MRLRPNQTTTPPPRRNKRQWRTQFVVVRRFQYRYAIFLGAAGLAASFIVGFITISLLSDNFDILLKQQLLTAPQMVDNMYMEFKLTNLLLISVLSGFVLFLALIGIKFSHRIVVPIYLIQEKMKQICRGNLKQAKVNIRKTDEFQEFGETYNYLVDSLQTQVKLDLDRLEQLKPDEHNRDAVHVWQTLIDEKVSQLNGGEISDTDPSASSHRAS